MKTVCHAVLVTALLTAGSLPSTASAAPEQSAGAERAGEAQDTSKAHATILIEGDAQFTQPNGVVSGSGTKDDPFVIANWSIRATERAGITVRDTSKHFVIRNCKVSDGKETGNPGIVFEKVRNGSVHSCTVTDVARAGIKLQGGSENCSVCNNRVTKVGKGGIGIWLEKTTKSLVEGNTVTEISHYGIFVWRGSDYNRIWQNDVSKSHLGIFLRYAAHYNLVLQNVCNHNGRAGIILSDGPHDNVVCLNTVDDNTYMPDLSSASGIWLWGAGENNLVCYNTVKGNGTKGGSAGISLSATANRPNAKTRGNTICCNWLEGNRPYQINVARGNEGNTIYGNTVIGRGRGESGGNRLNKEPPVGGNYWSEYQGADANGDGFGDTPFTQDRFPRTKPVTLDWMTPQRLLKLIDADGFSVEGMAKALDGRWKEAQ